MNAEIMDRIRDIRQRYRLDFEGDYGPFESPRFVAWGKDALLIGRDASGGSEIVVFDPVRSKPLETHRLPEIRLRSMDFEPDRNGVVLIAEREDVMRYDLESKKIERFNRFPVSLPLFRGSVNVADGRVYILSTCMHKVYIADPMGTLVREVELEGLFEFPLAVLPDTKNDRLVLVRFNDEIDENPKFASMVESFRKSSGRIGANVSMFDLQSRRLEKPRLLPEEPGQHPRGIHRIPGGGWLVHDKKTLFKLDADLRTVYRVPIEPTLFRDESGDALYSSSCFDESRLFLLESRTHRKIFTFRVA